MLSEVDIEVHSMMLVHILYLLWYVMRSYANEMSDMLLDDYDIYIQAINYPTVADGEERLRIAPTPLHTDAMMHNLVDALRKVFKRVQLKVMLRRIT